MKPTFASVCLAFSLLGCGSEGGHAPDAPESQKVTSDLVVSSDEISIPAGKEIQSCYYTTLPNDEDIYVERFDAVQGKGGHHVIIMTPLTPRPDGTTEDCTGGETMLNYIPLVTTLELNHMVVPEGLGVRIPAHTQVVLQSHYINTTENDITAVDTVTLGYEGADADVEPLSFWSTTVLDFDIPASSKYALKYKCTAESDMKVLSMLGHMHDNGAKVAIDLGPPDDVKRIYSVDTWSSDFRDHPPLQQWTKDEPLLVHAGDEIDVTCMWDSRQPKALQFPAEMCASNAWFYPATSTINCMGTTLDAGPWDGAMP